MRSKYPLTSCFKEAKFVLPSVELRAFEEATGIQHDDDT